MQPSRSPRSPTTRVRSSRIPCSSAWWELGPTGTASQRRRSVGRGGARGRAVARGRSPAGPRPLCPRAMGPMSAVVFGEPARSLTIVGVTGTNGKTTVVHLLDAVFRAAGPAPVRSARSVRTWPGSRSCSRGPPPRRPTSTDCSRGCGTAASRRSRWRSRRTRSTKSVSAVSPSTPRSSPTSRRTT